MGFDVYGSHDNIRGMRRGHYGHPGPANDHWSERRLDHVCSVPELYSNTLKGSMTH